MNITTIMGKRLNRLDLSPVILLRSVAILVLATVTALWIIQDSAIRRALILGKPAPAVAYFQNFLASQRAENLLDLGRLAAAESAARRALIVRPGDVVAIRTLALVADKQGDHDRAERLMATGARWSWRDNQTQVWLFNDLLHKGQFDAAIIHAEALVARDQYLDQIFPVFAELSAEPRASRPLVAALERGANWRNRFYGYLRNAPSQLQPALSRLMIALRNSEVPPTQRQAGPLLDAMIAGGNAAAARTLWIDLFWSHSQLPSDIIEPGFEDLPDAPGQAQLPSVFGWRFDPLAEIYVSPDPAGGQSRALHVASAGSSHAPFAQQRLVLEPGHWILTFRIQSAFRELPSRLRIGLRCGNGGQWLTEPLQSLPAARVWQRVDLPFRIHSGCTSQSLSIEPIGTRPGDPMEVWIDDFSVRRGA